MPVAELDGIEIAYELVGEGQPWVLTPGGRFTKEVGGLPEMARALADQGRRVLTWDRPTRLLLEKCYGSQLDIELYYFDGQCSRCQRRFVYDGGTEGGTALPVY